MEEQLYERLRSRGYPDRILRWYLTWIFSKCSRSWSRLVFRFCNTLGNDRDDMVRQLIKWAAAVAAAASAGTHNWIEDDVSVLIRRLPRHTFRSWSAAVGPVWLGHRKRGNILNGRRQYNLSIKIIYFYSFAHKRNDDDRKYWNTEDNEFEPLEDV